MSHCIIVGFSTPRQNKLLPWLIRKAEKTDFSHVYVKFYDARISRWMVYEASGLIVHCSPQDTFYKKNKVIAEFTIECTPEQEIEVLTVATDALALPYGMKQLIGLAWVRFCRMFGHRTTNPWTAGYICSEYGGLILAVLGYKIKDLNQLTPKDIYELINGKAI